MARLLVYEPSTVYFQHQYLVRFFHLFEHAGVCVHACIRMTQLGLAVKQGDKLSGKRKRV